MLDDLRNSQAGEIIFLVHTKVNMALMLELVARADYDDSSTRIEDMIIYFSVAVLIHNFLCRYDVFYLFKFKL